MITKVQTIAQLKQLFLELFINKTDKISDISDNSVVNATAYGVSKIAQKAIKDIAIVESHIFPDSAAGDYLDNSATLFGVSSRKEACGSSTYLRLVADSGTEYSADDLTFTSYSGIQFSLEEDVTIGDVGWGYGKVKSIDTGAKTNVDPNSIVTISSEPTGHVGVTNEYRATGGLDYEEDELFRERIKKHLNILSRQTIAYFTEVFQEINDNILKIINLGNNESGERVLSIVQQNGASLSDSELTELLDSAKSYFSITDLNRYGDTIGITLENATWTEIDMDFRVSILSSYDTDTVRKNIQIALTKYLDFRFWDDEDNVEWDELLSIVKNIDGVSYVPDTYFSPSSDIDVTSNTLPRIRGFIMRDTDGNIISDNNNVLLPIFYPS
jgi:uncharacterized phage protein gp47/JayE